MVYKSGCIYGVGDKPCFVRCKRVPVCIVAPFIELYIPLRLVKRGNIGIYRPFFGGYAELIKLFCKLYAAYGVLLVRLPVLYVYKRKQPFPRGHQAAPNPIKPKHSSAWADMYVIITGKLCLLTSFMNIARASIVSDVKKNIEPSSMSDA